MNKITTFNQLLAEEKRLSEKLALQKNEVMNEWQQTKNHLKPLGNVVGFVSKLGAKNSSNPLLNMGLDIGLDVVLQKLLLGRAGFLAKLFVPALVRNSGNIIDGKAGKGLFSKIRNLFKRSNNKPKELKPEEPVK